jgi:hypothetical protein
MELLMLVLAMVLLLLEQAHQRQPPRPLAENLLGSLLTVRRALADSVPHVRASATARARRVTPHTCGAYVYMYVVHMLDNTQHVQHV